MALTYSTLVAGKTTAGSIANFVNRSDLPVASILNETESWIYQRMRVREMQARGTLTFTTAAQTASLPSRFLDPISFTPYTWGDPLPLFHENALQDYRDENGNLLSAVPSRWSIIGETAYVDVLPISTFSGVLMYYAQPADLSGSNETNFMTTRYPKLLRHACMAMAYEHMKDTDRSAGYMQLAEADLQEAMRTNDMYRRGQHVPRD